LREHDVTASRIGALFGCHPYETLAGLAMAKRGVVLPDHDSAVLRRGRILESAVAAAVREEKPTWRVAKLNIYLRDRLLRLGATPDFAVTDEQGRRGILQAKTVAPLEFKRHWSDGVPPFWITLQCLTESMLDDAAIGYVAALVVDYTCPLHIFEIPRHAGAEARIRQRVAEFWQDVEAGREPKIDYERDGALVAAMYPHHVEGKAIDLRHDNRMPELLAARDALAERIRESEADKDVIENEIKSKIGDAETAIVPGWRVSLREQHRKEHTVRASSFRVLRTAKEQEKAA
jgi:predicted phage-related endonuclease